MHKKTMMQFFLLCDRLWPINIKLAIIIAGLLLAACSSTKYNATAYDYIYYDKLAPGTAVETVTIAPVNYGKPSRSYLARHSTAVNSQVDNYLRNAGFNLTNTEQQFLTHWRNAELEYGALFNPGTGRTTPARTQALADTVTAVFEANPELDAIIFTDIIEVSIHYESSSQRFAKWHGVQRNAHFAGSRRSIDRDFDWNQSIDGISLAVYIFNREQQMIFHSIGGIQLAQAIHVAGSRGQLRRRSDILDNTGEIIEGISLAFHPFITMQNYPGYAD